MGIINHIDISIEDKAELMALFKRYLPNTTVWAFGSRVKGTANATSDLDLVVFCAPEEADKVFLLKEALKDSFLPFRIDVLIWNELSENFKQNILENYFELITNHIPNLG